jgi:hypothetical protein
MRLGDKLRDAPAGTFVFIPKALVHTWQNVARSQGASSHSSCRRGWTTSSMGSQPCPLTHP